MLSAALRHHRFMENNAPRPNRIVWVEIPTKDIDRAEASYSKLLDSTMFRKTVAGQELSVFTTPTGAVGGALIQSEDHLPSEHGPTIFLNADPSLNAALERAWDLGLKVLQPATELPAAMGRFAVIMDSEGNRIGLHSVHA